MPVSPQPTPIQVPADFPVEWQSPEEEQLLWQWGNTHFPAPISALGWDLAHTSLAPGMFKGLRGMGTPIRDLRMRRNNTFVFMAMVPDFDLIPVAEERMQAAIKERGYTIYKRWLEEWQPE